MNSGPAWLREPAAERALGALQAIAAQAGDDSETTEAFFGRLSRSIAGLVHARVVAFLLQEEGDLVLQRGATGVDPSIAKGLPNIPCSKGDGSLASRVVFAGEVVRATMGDQSGALDAYRPWLDPMGIQDLVAVPWAAGELRLGAILAAGSFNSERFSDDDVWVLQAAATAAVLVWRQAQLTDRLVEAKGIETDRAQEVAKRMRELEQLKGHILNLAAHELRGPLAVIHGYLSMISDATLDEAGMRRVLPILLAKTRQMNSLILQMLDVARLEEGRLEVSRSPVELGKVLREAVDVAALLAPSGLTVFLERPPVPVSVLGDTGRISTIVSNVLDNAIKYSPNGGTVRVRLSREDKSAVITFEDEGLGIAEEHLPRLFTRFGRIVTSENSHISGTGLGLHLSRELAHLMGGDITVRSELGVGSTFELRLPALEVPPPTA